MGSNPGDVYCVIRKTWVRAKPEEIVRQRLISFMIHNLDFPAANLMLEKDLGQMPHLQLDPREAPERRADLVCFAKDIHPTHSLYPLLLVECKAVKITAKAIDQVVGYNHFLKAHFIAVANGLEVHTGWFDPQIQDYRFVKNLPSFPELVQSVTN